MAFITQTRCGSCALLKYDLLKGTYSCPQNPNLPRVTVKDFALECKRFKPKASDPKSRRTGR